MPLNVLFVDDSEEDVVLLEQELRRGGFETRHARVENVAAFVEALGRERWDLILCDYLVPGVDPAETIRTWRRLAPEVPLILVSTWLDERAAAGLMELGARDYVPKLAPARLVPVVRRELRMAPAPTPGSPPKRP